MYSKMFGRGLFVLSLGFGLGAGSVSAHEAESEPTHIFEIRSNTKKDRQKITELGFALDDVRSDKVFVTGRAADQKKLEAAGFRVRATVIKEQWRDSDSHSLLGNKFSSYAEIQTRMSDLVAKNPQLVSMQSYGRTHENRDLLMLRISGQSAAQAESQKTASILYMGCHHAREHLSVEIPMMFAEYLVENYAKNPIVKNLVDSREIFVAPVLNVDGHIYDYKDGRRGKMWRKNRRNNGDGTFGVDLNRNYGFAWGTGGSTRETKDDVFMGPAAFSEPETQAVRNFIRTQKRMTTLLSLHSFSELVLYPWGHTESPIGGTSAGNRADLPVFQKMARQMASWNHYQPMQSSELYIASGDTTDWAYGELGIFAFTFELSPADFWGGNFYPDPSRTIDPTFEANLKPMLYLLEYADNPRRVLQEKKRPSFDLTPARAGLPVADYKDLNFN